ncbi:TIGR02453 family protein [Roseobacter sp. HKCCD9010]|uniref:DUF2461 domain-containing protein n=1 Tax=unclassified Roseobacter TaxID=196798 RepID=UPI001491EE85|nr:MULTISPECIES: DUF2461 domain-containing protein [unclassified Roseobacter]MBF9049248.1 TIGR02453 family protein [Rhodobacterales bacterium HKCCD4356]NNV11248.1 TIGR02453 family protein [Roseobacter sp. HKCCD7357]NNV15432.1 TIGR02453 family protein [Roseobacter sp. HKCCD8768]NNV24892.1 TIGR02453 family protein [Roseobacter sp. HKCCD8192]NNV29149.1 TIGR02453 family protein [Roseobacter sp. HKCCD9061]
MAQVDGFTQMIDDSTAFFAELAQNNRKDWFDPRKDHYTQAIKKPAELFSELMAEELTKLLGRSMKGKVFRIYRDVRFSKDKTPYNTHLHILWSGTGDGPFNPGVFFAADTDGLWVGYGLPGLKGDALTRFRAFIDAKGAALAETLAATDMTLSTWGPEPLKRVPAPYAADHPQADLLKRKNLVIGAPVASDWRDHSNGLIGAVLDAVRVTLPLDRLFATHLIGGS